MENTPKGICLKCLGQPSTLHLATMCYRQHLPYCLQPGVFGSIAAWTPIITYLFIFLTHLLHRWEVFQMNVMRRKLKLCLPFYSVQIFPLCSCDWRLSGFGGWSLAAFRVCARGHIYTSDHWDQYGVHSGHSKLTLPLATYYSYHVHITLNRA